MQWSGRRESDNVDDERGSGGGGGRIAIGGGATILICLAAWALGIDPRQLLNSGLVDNAPSVQRTPDASQESLKHFVSVVLADTEDVWHVQFVKLGQTYREPRLVLFSGQVSSACGMAGSAVGPFYCPGDQKVYLDLEFFQELRDRFHAPGNFAEAYVVAHEVGHHVQKLLGVSDRVHAQRSRLSDRESNQLSVRLELQADFLAGVWAYHAQQMKKILDPGDLDAALRAANAIGDDRLQKQSRGYVTPDSFTHGTSAQRIRWFRKGFETGDVKLMEQLFSLPYSQL
ncbi:MAG TPA: neutral zinc metallopeptidase [Planctomycetota bacterium]|nr:neutral zinc metallopeptidase [Planctomycetota bacterium]